MLALIPLTESNFGSMVKSDCQAMSKGHLIDENFWANRVCCAGR